MVELQLLDLFFTLVHLAIIFFNLLGWIWPRTRKAHLVCVIATAASWFILGMWFGLGYCPITDWQWQIKEKLGEENLPSSFIKYFADKISGTNLDAALIDKLTAGIFALVFVLSVYLNLTRHRRR